MMENSMKVVQLTADDDAIQEQHSPCSSNDAGIASSLICSSVDAGSVSMPPGLARRRPRPAVPPPGYEGNFADGDQDSRNKCRTRSPRRPRPTGAPPISESEQCVQDSNPIWECHVELVAGTDVSSGANGSLASQEACKDEHIPQGVGVDNWRLASKTTAATRGRGSTPASTKVLGCQQKLYSSTADDSLLHSGRWVPAEYSLFKQTPWTGYWTCCGNRFGFTTHCTGFGARTRQREADFVREVAERQDRKRKELAADFRARWETEAETRSSEHTDGDESLTAGVAHPKRRSVDGDFPRLTSRPFVRRKWTERIARMQGMAFTAAANPKSGSSIGGKCSSSFLRNQLVVRREHVRAVVKLALSAARVNAFVAINSLEGLLSVAKEGLDVSAEAIHNDNDSLALRSAGSLDASSRFSEASGVQSSEPSNKRHLRRKNLLESSLEAIEVSDFSTSGATTRPILQSSTSNDGHLAGKAVGVPGVVAPAFQSSASGLGRQTESGSSVCINLGALPAILGCLIQHAGHAEIEALGMELLRMFALDSTTTHVIRGHTGVTAICTARLSSPPQLYSTAHPTVSATSKVLHSCPESTGQVRVLDGGEATNVCSRPDTPVVSNDGCVPDYSATLPEVPHNSSEAAPASNPRPSTSGENATAAPSLPARKEIIYADATAARQQEDKGNMNWSRCSRISEVAKYDVAVSELSSGGHCHGKKPARAPSVSANEGNTLATSGMSAATANPLLLVLSVNLLDSPDCRRLVLQRGGVEAALNCLNRNRGECVVDSHDPRLTESCLRILEELARVGDGRRRVMTSGGIDAALFAMDRFRADEGVLTAAMGLALVIGETPGGRRRILKAGGVTAIFRAMQRIVGEATVQVKGTDMLLTLISEERQARRELDGIKGGWQWLCQGTSAGNALLRYAPGEKHIAGWTISQEERITTSQAVEAAEKVASEWTAHKLATFIRLNCREAGVQLTRSTSDEYFRVAREAGLLPHLREDAEEWQRRTRRYEEDHHIRINNIIRRRLARDLRVRGSGTTSHVAAQRSDNHLKIDTR